MLLLLVDTAGTEGGVLLARGTDDRHVAVLAEKPLATREFSRELLPAIADVLAANQQKLSALDAIAVIAGPGSFTGLRIGLSAVKAIAEATGKPILALSRLAVLASMAKVPPDTSVHAVLDAGRGELYRGTYRNGGRQCLGESLETLDALRTGVQQNPGPVIVCEPAVEDALRADSGLALVRTELKAHAALPLACAAWLAKNFTGVAELDANYLRRLAPTTVAANAARASRL